MHSKKTATVGKNCVACGNCVKYCQFAAIAVCKGLYAKVDAAKCRSCGKCVKACPAGVIALVERGSDAR